MVIDISHVPPRRSYDLTWSWSGTGDEDSPYTVTVTATNEGGETRTTDLQVRCTVVSPPFLSQRHHSCSAAGNPAATTRRVFRDYDDTSGITASQGRSTE